MQTPGAMPGRSAPARWVGRGPARSARSARRWIFRAGSYRLKRARPVSTDVDDSGDRERSLGDIGGKDDPLAARWMEDAILLFVREAGEEGEHNRHPRAGGRNRISRQADLALAGEEDQDIAGVGAGRDELFHPHRRRARLPRARARSRRLCRGGSECPRGRPRPETSMTGRDGRAAEVVAEALWVDCRGG